MQKKILIFGSCVSRDPFNDLVKDFEVVDYFARSSLASLSGKPFSRSLELDLVSSKFQQRMITKDAKKVFFQRLENDDFDTLVIDFTDDRFHLLCFPDESLLTQSAELSKVKESLNISDAELINSFSDCYFDLWLVGYSNLIKILKNKNLIKKVVINGAFWASGDELGNRFDEKTSGQILRANMWFKKIYKEIEKDIPISQFCFYPEELLVANSKHKWGRAPFHFCPEFEEYFINFLRCNSPRVKNLVL